MSGAAGITVGAVDRSVSRLSRAFPWLTAAVGLLIAVPAAMHIVAVVGVAYRERDGYDARLADLLWIGWTSLVCGLLMLAAVPALRRGSAAAFAVATGAAAVFTVGMALLVPVSPGSVIGLAIFGGYLLAAATAVRTRAVNSPGVSGELAARER